MNEMTDWRKKAESEQVMFVSDINDTDNELILVSDSQEIDIIGDYLGINNLSDDFGCLFIEVNNGDYGYVFGVESNVPYLHYRLYDIDLWYETYRYQQEHGSE